MNDKEFKKLCKKYNIQTSERKEIHIDGSLKWSDLKAYIEKFCFENRVDDCNVEVELRNYDDDMYSKEAVLYTYIMVERTRQEMEKEINSIIEKEEKEKLRETLKIQKLKLAKEQKEKKLYEKLKTKYENK